MSESNIAKELERDRRTINRRLQMELTRDKITWLADTIQRALYVVVLWPKNPLNRSMGSTHLSQSATHVK